MVELQARFSQEHGVQAFCSTNVAHNTLSPDRAKVKARSIFSEVDERTAKRLFTEGDRATKPSEILNQLNMEAQLRGAKRRSGTHEKGFEGEQSVHVRHLKKAQVWEDGTRNF